MYVCVWQKQAEIEKAREAAQSLSERKAQGERGFKAWLAEKAAAKAKEKQALQQFLVG